MDTQVTLDVADDGSCEYCFPRSGKLHRLAVVTRLGVIPDTLFNLAVVRGESVIVLIEGAYTSSFPLLQTVMLDAGDRVVIRFNPSVVGLGAKVALLIVTD